MKPRRVDFFNYEEDFECAYMGAIGLSTKAIISRTKLSGGQITYRLKKAHIRRMDYRDGTSEFATIIYRKMRGAVAPELTRQLKHL